MKILEFGEFYKDKTTVSISITIIDIEKVLRLKVVVDSKDHLPLQYYKYLRIFNKQLSDQLSPYRQKVDYKIFLQKDESGKKVPFPWRPLYGMNCEEFLLLKKNFTELLEKDFIYTNSFSKTVSVFFVYKPEGGVRFYIDYCSLNYLSIKNHYPCWKSSQGCTEVSTDHVPEWIALLRNPHRRPSPGL